MCWEGPVHRKINKVIFDENTPVGPVNEKTKTLVDIERKVHREPSEGHEKILETLMLRASSNVNRMNNILTTHN